LKTKEFCSNCDLPLKPGKLKPFGDKIKLIVEFSSVEFSARENPADVPLIKNPRLLYDSKAEVPLNHLFVHTPNEASEE